MKHLVILLVALVGLLTPVWADPSIGWRTDGSGQYPQAQPPREWSLSKNVVWSTKMPAMSVASPIIVGERIFVCAEPCTLLCINKADGKILWQKENSYKEIVLSPELEAKVNAERKIDDGLKQQQAQVSSQMSVLKKMLTAGTAPRDATEKKLAELKAQFETLKEKRKALTLAVRYSEPNKNSAGGFSQCTPVSNGKQVLVGFGNGLVACYDLQGQRQWLRLIEHSTLTYGHGSSPVLVGDKLLVHYADLVALNIKDGSESWRTKLPPNYGTAIATRIGGEDVLIHPNGFLVRVRDGAILAKNLGSSGPNSPILHDGIAYYIRAEARAARLPATLTEALQPETLWKTRLTGGGYWFASPILHDGLLYDLSAQGILNVIEAGTGKKVYEQRLEFGKGDVYPSVTLAGGLLYISSDSGTTVILRPGREYQEVARNSLEPFRSTPVFEGRRMYVRTQKNLHCIGE